MRLIGIEKCAKARLDGTRTRRISSVAYATEDRGSEANTARARRFDSRWWAACAVFRGFPTSQRFRNIEVIIAHKWRRAHRRRSPQTV